MKKIKLKFSKLKPSGNITVLIWDKINKQDYSKISKKIIDNTYNLGAEQVGFITKSKNKNAILNLEMMGGEFCGNASRSLAYEIVRKRIIPYTKKDTEIKFNITSSGTDSLIECKVKIKNNYIKNVSVKIPIIEDFNSIETKKINNSTIRKIKLDGISHIIVDEKNFPFNQKTYEKDFMFFRNIFPNKNEKALGVIWFKKIKNNIYKINPVVWVNETNTYYYETACGSGTSALGLNLSLNKSSLEDAYEIYQPSNEKISTLVKKDINNFKSSYISGDVDLIADGFVYVSL